MSESARRRVQAIGAQLSSAGGKTGSMKGVPAIKQMAGRPNEPRVHGKVVIITGANSPLGIGRAAAYQFAHNGARAIYLCDFDDTHLGTYQRELQTPKLEVHKRRFDAADEEAVEEVVKDAVSRYGRLDVFFANAGISGQQRFYTEIDGDDFMQTMKVNALGPFLAAKHAAPAMQRITPEKVHAGGSIILTASVAGLRASAGATPYSASKAAVVSIVQTMAFQLAGTGVRINAVCPGIIETGMTAPLFEFARARGTPHKIGQLNPLKRAGVADEIARVALFLGSDESSYVNGQAWAVDGGLSAGHPYIQGRLS